MAGLVKLQAQLGDSLTATNNFQLTSAAADGTMKLARGNMGATTQDIITVAASTGIVTVNQGLATLPSVSGSFYEEYTGTCTSSGANTTATFSIRAVRVGKLVSVLVIPTNATSATVATSFVIPMNIPASMRIPSGQVDFISPFRMKDNGAYYTAAYLGVVDTGGSITLYSNTSGSSWTGAGVTGPVDQGTLTYSIQ